MMMRGQQQELMKKVYETGFAMDDVVLYLDTHPMDREAMNYYRYISQANREAVRAYEAVYGPLTNNMVTSDQWNWVNGPWPWEGGVN